jgi:hypothetical protein
VIDVFQVVSALPPLDGFPSVAKLHELVEKLNTENGAAEVQILGTSGNGVPIHDVRYGRGPVKALITGGPHAMEPIGSAVVYGLLTLLQEGHSQLARSPIEWHIVPCIDPDGAILNEGWTQQPFSLQSYMKHRYLQGVEDQVDTTFPIQYKRLSFNRPSKEARILQNVLDRVRPDFFFSLHNACTGGAFFFVSHDLGEERYRDIYRLLDEQCFPIQRRPTWREVCEPFSEGIVGMFRITKYYDYLESTMPEPEKMLPRGASSWDYLAEIKPDALTFIAELGHVLHPSADSNRETDQNLRQFKLRIDADTKFLGSLLLEELARVQSDLDKNSPFYRAMRGGMVLPSREQLVEGGSPVARYPTRDVLLNPSFNRLMTEADRYDACMIDGGFLFLGTTYQFVRLLKGSPQTPAIKSAIERLERAYDSAFEELTRSVQLERFEPVDCNTLARVQLGSGLIALNSVLQKLHRVAPHR